MNVTISDKVIFEELDGEVVLLELEGGNYYKLNGTGSEIWSLIREHGDVEIIERAVASKYAIDPDRARGDVARLLHELEAQGLVVIEPG